MICGGLLSLTACKKTIDLYPESNLNTGTYYSNLTELTAGLTACYNGLQTPLNTEWALTELRSDNTMQRDPGSSNNDNTEFNALDMFMPSTTNTWIYDYWKATYSNIRNANIVLEKLGVVYDSTKGETEFKAINLPIEDADRKRLAGEALIIRAHHYFNMVRLFGGVFLIPRSISPKEAKTINRSSRESIYKFIVADLTAAKDAMPTTKYTQMAAADKGRVTGYTAKGMLAKVYLTMGNKSAAIPLLTDVKDNSGYGLESNYTNVFSTSNEVNKEILFTVRFKAGGLGLGSPFANWFAPYSSQTNVINGDGKGWNYPTREIDTLVLLPNSDPRRSTLIGTYTVSKFPLYVKKFFSPVTIANDAENDWPVLRYSDILLMLAEAQGFNANSMALINMVHTRGGQNPELIEIDSQQEFEEALAQERRIEFAFENQRFFDLVRFNTTLNTIKAIEVMQKHFENEFATHYKNYASLTLDDLKARVTTEKLLLPIPQTELDTNPEFGIPQNPGY